MSQMPFYKVHKTKNDCVVLAPLIKNATIDYIIKYFIRKKMKTCGKGLLEYVGTRNCLFN